LKECESMVVEYIDVKSLMSAGILAICGSRVKNKGGGGRAWAVSFARATRGLRRPSLDARTRKRTTPSLDGREGCVLGPCAQVDGLDDHP